MEVNKTFNLLKSSISSLEKNQTLVLSKLTGTTSESRNKALSAIAELKPYFEADSADRRSLHFLLLINTESSISQDLENDQEVGHVVGFISSLSPYFYLLCVAECNLFAYIEEVMIHAPISLVLEVIAMVSKHSKHLPDNHVVQMHEKVLNGIATRITFGRCMFTARKLFEHFQELMLYYKIEAPSEDEKVDEKTLILAGFKILSVLKILRNLLKLSFNLIEAPEPIDVYKMSLTTDASRWYPHLELKNDLMECLEVAYFKCKSFLFELDIQMFMAWHETKLEGKTLQTVIGEEAYYVNEFLKNNLNSQNLPKGISELSEMLVGIVREPEVKREEDFVEKLSVERLEELIFEKAIDSKLVNSMKRFLAEEDNRFEFLISIKIIHKLCSEKKLHETAAEDVREIVLTMLRKSELNDLTSFLNDFLSEYGFSSILHKPTVDLSDVIKNLNLCYGGDEEENKNEELTIKKKEETLKEGVLLAYQSPEFVLSTLIEQSVLETNQKNGLLEMIRILKPLCLYVKSAGGSKDETSEHPLLIRVLERFLCCNYSKLSPSENQIFNELVIFSSNNGLIADNDEFLSQCLLPLLNLKNEINWEVTTNILKLFNEFYVTCVKESKLSTVIILAQLAQLLEQSRWSIETFSAERLAACEEIINLIQLFMKVYSQSQVPDKDKHWLSMQLRRFTYLTKSYLPYIYEENESKNVESLFLSLIHNPSTELDLDTGDTSSLILPISKVLINLTPKEMQNIVANYSAGSSQRIFSVLNLISDAVAFVCGSAAQFTAFLSGDNHPIFSCLGHVINNYLGVLQVNINSECKSAEDHANYIKCVNRIAITLKSFPKHLLRTYQFNALKIVNDILPKLQENSTDLDGDTRQLLLGLFLF